MPAFTFNLFKLKPSTEGVEVTFLPIFNTSLTHELRNAEYPCAGLAEGYAGLEMGTYVLADRDDRLIGEIARSLSIDTNTFRKEIGSQSYVMKYILSEVLAKKLEALGGRVWLPHDWNKFGTLTFCFPEIIRRSTPNELFSARQTCSLRIEHQEEGLFVELDAYHRRFPDLGLTRILPILEGKRVPESACVSLKCYVELEDEYGTHRLQGYIRSMGEQVEVMTETGVVSANKDQISVNSHFFDARRFISTQLGEDLNGFDSALRNQIKYPIDRMKAICEKAVEIRSLLFPLQISDLKYDLETNPMALEISTADAESGS